jgi:hypothetical protein
LLGAGASAGKEGKGASTYRRESCARNDGHVVGSGRAERWHQATLTGTWNLKQESPSRKDGTDKRYRVQSWLYFIGVVSGQAEVRTQVHGWHEHGRQFCFSTVSTLPKH